jgi:hypothetical protein
MLSVDLIGETKAADRGKELSRSTFRIKNPIGLKVPDSRI